jgi:hydrogenase small subunit
MAPFYGRLPNVAGFGIESKIDVIGAGLAIGATAGVLAHAAATGIYQMRRRRKEEAAKAGTVAAGTAATGGATSSEPKKEG